MPEWRPDIICHTYYVEKLEDIPNLIKVLGKNSKKRRNEGG